MQSAQACLRDPEDSQFGFATRYGLVKEVSESLESTGLDALWKIL